MSLLELVLLPAVALLSAALVVTTVLWLRARHQAIGLRKRIAQVEGPRRRRRRLVPTPTQAVRGAVETAIMLKDHGLGGVLRSSIEDLAGWADVERPDLARIAALDGTVTILFSDIEDSTALNHELGDRAWVHLLQKHDRIVTKAVQQHGGHVVKTQGDGFMVAFGSPVEATRAAVEVQRSMAGVRPTSRLASVNVRIGAHRGATVHRGNDLFGASVAMAARVASQAEGGEVLVSETVAELLDDDEFTVLEPREASLKGIPGTHLLHPVDWTP